MSDAKHDIYPRDFGNDAYSYIAATCTTYTHLFLVAHCLFRLHGMPLLETQIVQVKIILIIYAKGKGIRCS